MGGFLFVPILPKEKIMIQSQEEDCENEITGRYIPEHIITTFEKGEINAKEVLLLAEINGLPDRSEGKLLYKTLGKLLHTSNIQIKQMVNHLKELNLIHVEEHNANTTLLESDCGLGSI